MAGACGDAADGEDAADPGDGGRDSLVDTSEDADAGDPDATADGGPAYVVPGFDVAAIDFPYCEVDARDIDARLAALDARGRLGQHLLVGIQGGAAGPTADGRRWLEEYAVGGMFTGAPAGIAVGDPVATARFVAAVQRLAIDATGHPLFVALDQEGGPNANVNSVTGGTDTIGSMPIGATVDPQVAWEEFDIMGREVRALGFNMDFGPVLDTQRSTRNGNLNTRSFGPDAELNAVLGVAAMAGLQHNLVLPTGKHFAGDGLSDGNPHRVEVSVDVSREVLDDVLLRPFRAAIDAGLDGIMTMPASFPAIDGQRSAITSRAMTTGLLRGELGFEGIVVTDALGMAGVRIGLQEDDVAGLEALKAGADVLLYVTPDEETLDALYAAVDLALADGTLDAGEFEASTRRILEYKARYCLYETDLGVEPDADAVLAALGRAEDQALADGHAERAIVVLENDGILPLDPGSVVVFVGPDTIFQDPGSGWLNIVDQTLGEAMRGVGGDVTDVVWPLLPNADATLRQVVREVEARDADVVVLATLQGRFSFEQQQLAEWLIDAVEVPLVHVMLGVPFDYFQTRDRVAGAIALMGSRGPMLRAGARVLYGDLEATGTMLYDLSVEGGFVGDLGDPEDPGTQTEDRCETEGIDCSGQGACVDTGADFGCVCHPNWHPSADGLDCEPDGSGG